MAGKNIHFESVATLAEAQQWLAFEPVEPAATAGCSLQSISIHVRDHRRRELSPRARTLELYYGDFSFSQLLATGGEARRKALQTAYGSEPRSVWIAGHEGRIYERGPEPEPDDIDPRMPAVVTWYVGNRFYLLASDRLEAARLLDIAGTVPMLAD